MEKEEGQNQLEHFCLQLDDRRHFELSWEFHALRQKCRPLYHPLDKWIEDNSMNVWKKANLAGEAGDNASPVFRAYIRNA